MYQIIFPLFLLIHAVLPQTALAAPSVYFISDTAVNDLPLSTSTMKSLVGFYSEYYEVSSSTMNTIISKESGFNQYAENYNPPKEDSIGLAQINLLSHDVTREQAESAVYSINFLAYHLSLGECHTTWKATCPSDGT